MKELEAQIGRHLMLIAESDLNDPRIVRSRRSAATVSTPNGATIFIMRCILCSPANAPAIMPISARWRIWPKQSSGYSSMTAVIRHFATQTWRPAKGILGHAFLGYLQNHDQIGNRAQGERSSHLLSLGRLKIAAALVLTAPFIPMLFQGEEWAASSPFLYFTNHEDAELGRLVTEGRRREFAAFSAHSDDVPDPQALETFERSKLVWEESSRAPHAEMLDWHRQLIRLRHEVAALSDGRLDRVTVTCDEQAKWLVMVRGRIALACNLSACRQRTPLSVGKDARILLASDKEIQLVGNRIELAPDSVAIVEAIGNRGSAMRQ